MRTNLVSEVQYVVCFHAKFGNSSWDRRTERDGTRIGIEFSLLKNAIDSALNTAGLTDQLLNDPLTFQILVVFRTFNVLKSSFKTQRVVVRAFGLCYQDQHLSVLTSFQVGTLMSMSSTNRTVSEELLCESGLLVLLKKTLFCSRNHYKRTSHCKRLQDLDNLAHLCTLFFIFLGRARCSRG